MGRLVTWSVRSATLIVLAIGFALLLVSSAKAGANGPCAKIRKACREAGFVEGGARSGNGLKHDCMDPILQGTSQPVRASRSLPQIDPSQVAACKAAETGAAMQ